MPCQFVDLHGDHDINFVSPPRNDILGISKKPPRDGDICILIHKPTGRAFIRKLQQGNPCQLLPINGYGDIITVDPNNHTDMVQWLKFGVVIAVLRR